MTEEDGTPSETPPDDSLLEALAALEEDNETLRLRTLEVLEWMEEAVTDLVATERKAADFEQQAAALQRELDAIHRSVTWRVAALPRSWYGRLRRRGAR